MKTPTQNQPRDLTTAQVVKQLEEIVAQMKSANTAATNLLVNVHTNFVLSAKNLLDYLVFRSQEIRQTQDFLLQNGLSSLAHSEGHTRAQIERVLAWLKGTLPQEIACNLKTASLLKTAHAEQLMGILPGNDRPHIMVTLSADNYAEPGLMEEMMNQGMSVARINCAHDDALVWQNMIDHVNAAITKTGHACKIYMDLAGPKIRINSILANRKKHKAKLPIAKGDTLLLTGDAETAAKWQSKQQKWTSALVVEPAEIIPMIKTGEQLYFDDGKFSALVTDTGHDWVTIKIKRITAKKAQLKPQKGINLPNSNLSIVPLTEQDLANLPFICQHADMVGFSFVNRPEDIDDLRQQMNLCSTAKHPNIILKIERLAAVQNLPQLLLNGMQDPAFGVMIARGDLAVEIGFERLSEIQEEILWICEAAHTPVIWATQVLENLNKEGVATRSEITDAAMAVRAECVMLNKGAYIIKTITTLNDILTRQQGHISKKRYVMRPLSIARNFINELA
jgi:pyruvate kinase